MGFAIGIVAGFVAGLLIGREVNNAPVGIEYRHGMHFITSRSVAAAAKEAYQLGVIDGRDEANEGHRRAGLRQMATLRGFDLHEVAESQGPKVIPMHRHTYLGRGHSA